MVRLRDLLDWPRVFLPHNPGAPLSITLARDTEREARARDQLLRLLERHDVRAWQYTNRVRIEQGAIPHSHPLLTLNTQYLEDDALALGTYLHEQLHWFVWRRSAQRRAAVRELRRRYPNVPVGHPRGSPDEAGSYLHYVVCFLEYVSLIEVLGADEARRIIDYWASHHYTEIYKTVLRDFDGIGEIVSRHGLMP